MIHFPGQCHVQCPEDIIEAEIQCQCRDLQWKRETYERKSCRSQTLKVCARWLGEGKESNMAIIDVRMISGFTANETV